MYLLIILYIYIYIIADGAPRGTCALLAPLIGDRTAIVQPVLMQSPTKPPLPGWSEQALDSTDLRMFLSLKAFVSLFMIVFLHLLGFKRSLFHIPAPQNLRGSGWPETFTHVAPAPRRAAARGRLPRGVASSDPSGMKLGAGRAAGRLREGEGQLEGF